MQPGTQTVRLQCKQCDEIYKQKLLVWVPLKVWAMHVKSLRCPNCGATSRQLGFVTGEKVLRKHIEAKP